MAATTTRHTTPCVYILHVCGARDGVKIKKTAGPTEKGASDV